MYECKAGDAKIPHKIIGGNVTRIEEMPHAVSIRSSGEHNCGGSFIDLDHVITAAHCLVLPDNIIDNEIQVLSGTNNQQDTLDGTIHEVIMIIVHPGYKHGSFFNDIAICKVCIFKKQTQRKIKVYKKTKNPLLYWKNKKEEKLIFGFSAAC